MFYLCSTTKNLIYSLAGTFSSLLVQLGGLEPPTSCSTDRRSNQLSYNCILGSPENGGGERGGNSVQRSALARPRDALFWWFGERLKCTPAGDWERKRPLSSLA